MAEAGVLLHLTAVRKYGAKTTFRWQWYLWKTNGKTVDGVNGIRIDEMLAKLYSLVPARVN